MYPPARDAAAPLVSQSAASGVGTIMARRWVAAEQSGGADILGRPAAPAEAHHDRFTIPLRERGPFHFYVHSLLVPHSRRELAWAAFARAGRGPGRLALPILGSKSAQGLRGRPGAQGAVHELVQRTCAALLEAGAIGASEPSTILLNDYGNSDRGKMVLFIFEPQARRPSVVAKVSSSPAQRDTLRQEQATLRTLHERLPRRLLKSVPMPLAEAGDGAAAAFAETYIGRTSMYVEMRNSWSPRRQAEKHFRAALPWLVQFQAATVADRVRLDEGVICEHVEAPLAEYSRSCAPSPAVERMFGRTIQNARALTHERLPLTARHGDFWARNVMLGEGGVSVIDWDGYKDCSPPFHDLFHFAVSYGLSYPWQLGRWADPSAAFRSTILADTWLSRLLRELLRDYCRVMAVSPVLLQVFFPVYLAEQALAEARAATSANGRESGGTDRQYFSGRWGRLLEDYAASGRSSCLLLTSRGEARLA